MEQKNIITDKQQEKNERINQIREVAIILCAAAAMSWLSPSIDRNAEKADHKDIHKANMHFTPKN